MMDYIEVSSTPLELVFHENIPLINNSSFGDVKNEIDVLLSIDVHNLENEILRLPSILSELHNELQNFAVQLQSYIHLQSQMEVLLFKYYGKRMTDKEYKKYAKSHPLPNANQTASQIKETVYLTQEMIQLSGSISCLKRIVQFIEDNIKQVQFNWVKSISASMEWRRFMASGGM